MTPLYQWMLSFKLERKLTLYFWNLIIFLLLGRFTNIGLPNIQSNELLVGFVKFSPILAALLSTSCTLIATYTLKRRPSCRFVVMIGSVVIWMNVFRDSHAFFGKRLILLCRYLNSIWQGECVEMSFCLTYASLVLMEEAPVMLAWERAAYHLAEAERQRMFSNILYTNPWRHLSNSNLRPILQSNIYFWTPIMRCLFMIMTVLHLICDFLMIGLVLQHKYIHEILIGEIFAVSTWYLIYRDYNAGNNFRAENRDFRRFYENDYSLQTSDYSFHYWIYKLSQYFPFNLFIDLLETFDEHAFPGDHHPFCNTNMHLNSYIEIPRNNCSRLSFGARCPRVPHFNIEILENQRKSTCPMVINYDSDSVLAFNTPRRLIDRDHYIGNEHYKGRRIFN